MAVFLVSSRKIASRLALGKAMRGIKTTMKMIIIAISNLVRPFLGFIAFIIAYYVV